MIRICKNALLGLGFAAIVVSVVAFMPHAKGGDVTTQFDIGKKLQFALESPVPVDEALRNITLITQGVSETSLVLFAAVIRRDAVVALESSRAFHVRGSASLFAVWPKEWSGYLPGEYTIPDGQFKPGDQFIPGDQPMPGDQFLRLGGSASGFLRQAGVQSGGRDFLVLFVVPADERARESAWVKPLFIVGQNGFGP